jgi:hypothetical protein
MFFSLVQAGFIASSIKGCAILECLRQTGVAACYASPFSAGRGADVSSTVEMKSLLPIFGEPDQESLIIFHLLLEITMGG